MNLAHRTIKNALFNTLGWVLPLGLQFLLLPYIVGKLGTDAYGILTLVLTVIGYFALLDLGLENAIIKYVAEYNAEGNAAKINEVIGVTLLIFLFLGVVGGLAILTIAKPLTTKFLKIPPELISVAYLAFSLASAGFFVTMFLSIFSAIPNGLNRYDITSTLTVIMGVSTMAGTAFLLYLGLGLVHIVILNISISLLAIIVYAFIAKRLLPTIQVIPAFNFLVLKKIIRFGLFSLLSRLSYIINYQADRIVTGAILGVSWVTYYVVPFTIVSRITMLTVRMGTVIFPAISELQGKKQHDTITELYLTASRVITTVATAICLPLIFFGGRLLALWMGPDFGEKGGLVIVLITLALYLSALTNVPTFVVDGLGRPKISGLASLCNAFLNLALVIPLAMYMGINGVATAFFVSNICVTPVFIWYVNNKIVQIPLMRLMREAYAKPLFAGLLMLPALISFPKDRIDNVFQLLGIIAMSGFVYFGVSSLIGVFPRQERKVVFDYFRIVLDKIHR